MEESSKNKLKIQDMIKELDNIKAYAKELSNNTNSETIENYIYKIEKDIIKVENKLETIYIKNHK